MAKRGHEPRRTCLGCGTRERQRDMLRVIVEASGVLKIAAHGQRGGYLHRRAECWQGFVNRKSHFRAFRCEVAKPVKEALVRELRSRDGE